ncbi:PREDICTED: protein ULTRAPETALA 1-like isoform X1 [Nelumbo nucifera]|uniref:Protein ULTRAPETALA 1-like isoform X1 n=1 Tax=Nelumbo nucifera TaxID=4432 RepID=A0A1U8QCA1_NELNU|nr:PREDICTED: protein ULTRAPETALA 1-like isoform X1 [Nelumbo nucifera]
MHPWLSGRLAHSVLVFSLAFGLLLGNGQWVWIYIHVEMSLSASRTGFNVTKRLLFFNLFEASNDVAFLFYTYKLTPAAFEKHSGRETARKWKSNVWVIVNGEKVPLSKTVLLKYYNKASKNANGHHKSHNGRPCHRDEFVRCTKCNKERRFRLRTKEECRIHHDALANRSWKCADLPYDKITCDNDEERASRKVYRGCSRSPTCSGCTSCVCFGCDICRFSDCSCQTCVDFTRNAEA